MSWFSEDNIIYVQKAEGVGSSRIGKPIQGLMDIVHLNLSTPNQLSAGKTHQRCLLHPQKQIFSSLILFAASLVENCV